MYIQMSINVFKPLKYDNIIRLMHFKNISTIDVHLFA